MKRFNWLTLSLLTAGTCGVLIWMMPPMAHHESSSITASTDSNGIQPTTPAAALPLVQHNVTSDHSADHCNPSCLVQRLLNPALSAVPFEQQLHDLQQHDPAIVAAVLLDTALALCPVSASKRSQFDAIVQALSTLTQPQASLWLAQAFLERDELHRPLAEQQMLRQAIQQAVYHSTDRLTVASQLYQQYQAQTHHAHQQRLLDLGASDVLAQVWLDTRATQTPDQTTALDQAIAQSNDPHMVETFFKLHTSSSEQQRDELYTLSGTWMNQHATDDIIFTLEQYVRTTELTAAQQQFLQHLLENSTSPLASVILQKQMASSATKDFLQEK